jgi:hypothetical protein
MTAQTTRPERLYHVVAINERTGYTVRMTAYPCTHEEGCTIMGKLLRHPARRVQLEEIYHA